MLAPSNGFLMCHQVSSCYKWLLKPPLLVSLKWLKCHLHGQRNEKRNEINYNTVESNAPQKPFSSIILLSTLRVPIHSNIIMMYISESQIHEAERFEWLTKEHLCVLVYLVRMQLELHPLNLKRRVSLYVHLLLFLHQCCLR